MIMQLKKKLLNLFLPATDFFKHCFNLPHFFFQLITVQKTIHSHGARLTNKIPNKVEFQKSTTVLVGSCRNRVTIKIKISVASGCVSIT